MKLDVRLMRESDRTSLHYMANAGQCEIRPNLTFDPDRWDATLDRCLTQEWPAMLVLTADGAPCGFLLAELLEYAGAAGFFINQAILYVRPDKRSGTRAAAILLASFTRWARSFNPEEIYCGIAEGSASEAAARFLRPLGYQPSGQQIVRQVVGRQ